jgi:A/G-specific adenine glycosylase
VDGNVARVLMRIEGKPLAHGSPQALRWAWERASVLVGHTKPGQRGRSPALFNEGLMELGATICTPRNPECGRCPMAALCKARANGTQHRIPRPKAEPQRKVVYCAAAVVTDSRGRLLLEQRGDTGMWAAMWQAPTLEHTREIKAIQVRSWLRLSAMEPAGAFSHQTTHRQLHFTVWRARLGRNKSLQVGRSLVLREQLADLGMGSAQRRVITLGLS